ncbi:MAG: hypothetical protein HKP06_00120 [Flavobacteriaceae bacterium]|nr:hypothetical protein [Flavobacteriaceae bacterium]
MDTNKDYFVVVLPSNTPSSFVNTPSKWHTELDTPIYLDNTNEWEVGLMELNFINSIKTIHKDYALMAYRERSYFPDVHIKVNKKYYEYYLKDAHKFEMQFISDQGDVYTKMRLFRLEGFKDVEPFEFDYEDFKIVYNKDTKRFTITAKNPDLAKVYLPSHFAKVLGFQEAAVSEDGVYQVPYRRDEVTTIMLEEKKEITGTDCLYITSLSGDAKYLPYFPLVEAGDEYKNTDVKEPAFKISKFRPPSEKDRIWDLEKMEPREGTYTTAEDLIDELNQHKIHKQFWTFSVDKRLNRCIITPTHKARDKMLYLLNGLNDVLGFRDKIFENMDKPVTGDLEIDLLRGIKSIFVYCDLCEPIHVGHTVAPLLRVVSFNPVQYGKMVHLNYVNPIYIKVNKRVINSIDINISDSVGENIPFIEGLTTLVLHFRRL